jgi:raffinose/stachyose/melibiose transport system permease protein
MRVKTASGIGLGAAKAALAAVFFAPFYISFIYSVKTRDEIAFTGLAFPRTIHFENFAQASRCPISGWPSGTASSRPSPRSR